MEMQCGIVEGAAGFYRRIAKLVKTFSSPVSDFGVTLIRGPRSYGKSEAPMLLDLSSCTERSVC